MELLVQYMNAVHCISDNDHIYYLAALGGLCNREYIFVHMN